MTRSQKSPLHALRFFELFIFPDAVTIPIYFCNKHQQDESSSKQVVLI